MKRGSGEPEESIIRTARGLYVGDLINEKEQIYSRLYTHTVYSRVLECFSPSACLFSCAHTLAYTEFSPSRTNVYPYQFRCISRQATAGYI